MRSTYYSKAPRLHDMTYLQCNANTTCREREAISGFQRDGKHIKQRTKSDEELDFIPGHPVTIGMQRSVTHYLIFQSPMRFILKSTNAARCFDINNFSPNGERRSWPCFSYIPHTPSDVTSPAIPAIRSLNAVRKRKSLPVTSMTRSWGCGAG